MSLKTFRFAALLWMAHSLIAILLYAEFVWRGMPPVVPAEGLLSFLPIGMHLDLPVGCFLTLLTISKIYPFHSLAWSSVFAMMSYFILGGVQWYFIGEAIDALRHLSKKG